MSSPADLGPAPLHFSDERDLDVFLDALRKFESGELNADEWRGIRLLHGTYGQRQVGDLSMLRAKVPQGRLLPEQLRAVADAAERFGQGIAHITTRQNFQIHFIPLAEVEPAMRLLAEVGITTKEACGNSVRNITCGATAGVAPDEIFDVTPYSEALTRHLLRHPLSSKLPRKFKVAFAGSAEDHAFALINDIGWHARLDAAGKRGFRVTVAGGTATVCSSGQELFAFLPAGEMFGVAEALLRVFDRLGDRVHRHKNRMKFLVKQLGWPEFAALVRAELDLLRAAGLPPLPFDPESPPIAEIPPDRATRAPRPTSQELAALVPSVPSTLPLASDEHRWRQSNVSPQRQAGYSYVTVTVPLGDLTAGQLRALARLAESFGNGVLRTTHGQNLLFRWIENDELSALYAALRTIGLSRANQESIADVSSCPGADSCKLAVTRSRGLGRLFVDAFDDRPDLIDKSGNLTIKISGCPNGCGLHHVGGLGFQGGLRKIGGKAVPQYFVLAGGGADTEADGGKIHFGKVVAKVPARRMPAVVERLVELYQGERLSPSEPMAAFLRRVPPARLKATLADLEAIDETTALPEDYIDLGDTTEFVPEVGEGECAV